MSLPIPGVCFCGKGGRPRPISLIMIDAIMTIRREIMLGFILSLAFQISTNKGRRDFSPALVINQVHRLPLQHS